MPFYQNEVNCRISKLILNYIAKYHPESMKGFIAAIKPIAPDMGYLSSESNWVSYQCMTQIYAKVFELTQDPFILYKIALKLKELLPKTLPIVIFAPYHTSGNAFQNVGKFIGFFEKVSRIELKQLRRHSALIAVAQTENQPADWFHIQMLRGLLETIPALYDSELIGSQLPECAVPIYETPDIFNEKHTLIGESIFDHAFYRIAGKDEPYAFGETIFNTQITVIKVDWEDKRGIFNLPFFKQRNIQVNVLEKLEENNRELEEKWVIIQDLNKKLQEKVTEQNMQLELLYRISELKKGFLESMTADTLDDPEKLVSKYIATISEFARIIDYHILVYFNERTIIVSKNEGVTQKEASSFAEMTEIAGARLGINIVSFTVPYAFEIVLNLPQWTFLRKLHTSKGYYGFICLQTDSPELNQLVEEITVYFCSWMEHFILLESLNLLSRVDPLTSLYNRREFIAHFEDLIKNHQRYKIGFSLAIVDVDNFKKINDTEGHIQGDAVLKELSQLILQNIRENDKAFRVGGDEFAIVFYNTLSKDSIIALKRISSQFKSTTLSIGIGDYDSRFKTMDEFLNEIDQALYRSKKKGKNRIEAL